MSQIPEGTRFIGIATDVDLKERKSAVLNKTTEPFTIEDIVDGLGIVTLWQGEAYDKIGQWTDKDVESKLLELYK